MGPEGNEEWIRTASLAIETEIGKLEEEYRTILEQNRMLREEINSLELEWPVYPANGMGDVEKEMSSLLMVTLSGYMRELAGLQEKLESEDQAQERILLEKGKERDRLHRILKDSAAFIRKALEEESVETRLEEELYDG